MLDPVGGDIHYCPFLSYTRAIISFTIYGLIRPIELPKMRETALLPNKQVRPQAFIKESLSHRH